MSDAELEDVIATDQIVEAALSSQKRKRLLTTPVAVIVGSIVIATGIVIAAWMYTPVPLNREEALFLEGYRKDRVDTRKRLEGSDATEHAILAAEYMTKFDSTDIKNLKPSDLAQFRDGAVRDAAQRVFISETRSQDEHN